MLEKKLNSEIFVFEFYGRFFDLLYESVCVNLFFKQEIIEIKKTFL